MDNKHRWSTHYLHIYLKRISNQTINWWWALATEVMAKMVQFQSYLRYVYISASLSFALWCLFCLLPRTHKFILAITAKYQSSLKWKKKRFAHFLWIKLSLKVDILIKTKQTYQCSHCNTFGYGFFFSGKNSYSNNKRYRKLLICLICLATGHNIQLYFGFFFFQNWTVTFFRFIFFSHKRHSNSNKIKKLQMRFVLLFFLFIFVIFFRFAYDVFFARYFQHFER